MSTEREIKLSVPPGFCLPTLEGVAGLCASSPMTETLQTTYFDTDDLRIARWGAALRQRKGQGWTVKLPDAGDGVLLARPEYTFPGDSAQPPRQALELVTAFARGAKLHSVTRMRTVRTTIALTQEDGSPVAEVADDEVTVFDGRRVAARFREIEVELAPRANRAPLSQIVAALHDAGAGPFDLTPKGVRALGFRAQGAPDVSSDMHPGRGATVEEVISAALAGSVARLIRHDAGVRLGEDVESVHQARVATRRLRSDLRTFRSVLDPAWNRPLRDDLERLADALGAVRDTDVLLGKLRALADDVLPERDQRAGERLLARLTRDRDDARTELLHVMRAPAYVGLLDRLVEATRHPTFRSGLARQPAAPVLGERVRHLWDKVAEDAGALSKPPLDEELHALRIRVKRVRYAASVLEPVFGKRAHTFVEAAAAMQDALGVHQDAVIADAWLREASKRRGTEAFVAGELAAHEARIAAGARKSWRAAWKELSRKKLRAWLPETEVGPTGPIATVSVLVPTPGPRAVPTSVSSPTSKPDERDERDARDTIATPRPAVVSVSPHTGPVANAAVIARHAVETSRAEEAARKGALNEELAARVAAAAPALDHAGQTAEQDPLNEVKDEAKDTVIPAASGEPSANAGP